MKETPHTTIHNENPDGLAEILQKYDKESSFRPLEGIPAKCVFVLAVGWSLFQLYTAIWGTFPSTIQRAPHLGAAMMLAFMLYPAHGKPGKKIPLYDYFFVLCSFLCSLYHLVFYEDLLMRIGIYTLPDLIVSVVAVVLLLEATRRVIGPVIVSLATFFLFYGVFGQYFPGFMSHAGLSFKKVMTFQWLGTEAILGTPIYVSSTFIFLFLVFATFLKNSGVGDWMTDLALATCGGQVGGPAKAAVLASALQGTVSGSSVGNTVSTGSITIPLMKRTGYRPEFAGAVEAAASTGGQIMPPIMGAACFIMVEYIGAPYSTIALAACIPALLYFTGIFMNVHFEALKNNLKGIPQSERPQLGALIRRGWYKVLPIIAIVAFLVMGFTAMRAALMGIASCLAIWIIEIVRTTKTFHLGNFFVKLIGTLEDSARGAVSVAVACGCAGVIVGVIMQTSLGLKLASGVVDLAGGNLILTMVFTMICSLILGMGVPTTANYIIQASITAPALVALGIPQIAAHMFAFYFGIVADITPPVALAAFAGAGIAKANPMKTGFIAFRLGFAAYLVPYLFVMNPILLFVRPEGVSGLAFALHMAVAIATSLVGMGGIATGMTGFFIKKCHAWERILLVLGGISLVDPNLATDVVGIALIAAVGARQYFSAKKELATPRAG